MQKVHSVSFLLGLLTHGWLSGCSFAECHLNLLLGKGLEANLLLRQKSTFDFISRCCQPYSCCETSHRRDSPYPLATNVLHIEWLFQMLLDNRLGKINAQIVQIVIRIPQVPIIRVSMCPNSIHCMYRARWSMQSIESMVSPSRLPYTSWPN